MRTAIALINKETKEIELWTMSWWIRYQDLVPPEKIPYIPAPEEIQEKYNCLYI